MKNYEKINQKRNRRNYIFIKKQCFKMMEYFKKRGDDKTVDCLMECWNDYDNYYQELLNNNNVVDKII